MTGELINIDQPIDLDADLLLPDWVKEHIEQTEASTFEEVFSSQGLEDARRGSKVYPMTAFCLLQLCRGPGNMRWIRPSTLQNRHKKGKLNYAEKAKTQTYSSTLKDLAAAGVVERDKDGKTTKYGLPPGREIAPAFDPANPENRLDRITMDDPDPKSDPATALWALPSMSDRPAVIPAQVATGRFGNPWDAGLVFLTLGVGLAVQYTGKLSFGGANLSMTVAGLLWGLLAVGIAAMLVEVLDQVRAGYHSPEWS